MNPLLGNILTVLKDRGVVVSAESVEKHEHQGFMSTVYTADSNAGKLLIQISNLVDEHQRNKVWDKFKGLAAILKDHPGIPTSQLLLADLIDGQNVIVQTFLEGDRAGRRILQGIEIIDEWHVSEKDILPKALRALAVVHAIKPAAFGWQAVNMGEKTAYLTWREFVEKESPNWIAAVAATDEQLHEKLLSFVSEIISHINYSGPAVLVHGDAINPSNLLVRDKEIALLDWEWAIGADPAWEFCDIGWKPYRTEEGLAPYFEASGIQGAQRTEFLRRVDLYAPLWLLWGAYMHTKDENPHIYLVLKEALVASIR